VGKQCRGEWTNGKILYEWRVRKCSIGAPAQGEGRQDSPACNRETPVHPRAQPTRTAVLLSQVCFSYGNTTQAATSSSLTSSPLP